MDKFIRAPFTFSVTNEFISHSTLKNDALAHFVRAHRVNREYKARRTLRAQREVWPEMVLCRVILFLLSKFQQSVEIVIHAFGRAS